MVPMRVLLDESLPRRLRSLFGEHHVRTVPEQGWSGKSNGELLDLAESDFEVFITADQNLQYQQNLQGRTFPIIVLAARTNRYQDLAPLIPRTIEAMATAAPGEVVIISAAG